jgi:uncharacterized membrane protein
LLGAALGAIGAVTGAYAGYHARTRTVGVLKLPDVPVALAEDLLTIAGSYFLVSLFA